MLKLIGKARDVEAIIEECKTLFPMLFLLAGAVVFLIWLQSKWDDLGEFTQIYLVGMISYWARCGLRIIANCMRRFSCFDQNMAKIGMTRNIILGGFQGRVFRDFLGIELVGKQNFLASLEDIFLSIFLVLLTSLLSWFAFVVDAFSFIKRIIYRRRIPRTIRELQWTLKNHDLSPVDVLRFDVKIAEALLHRRLTKEECDIRQQTLNERGIVVQMLDVIALNDNGTISEKK